jgi:(2R)-ethylmalonyl-CoA mutase
MADKPWIMRTYSGHSSAEASNELYKTNLKKGQTGLSIAFDLPTQIGYDPDSPFARGEVGKVGVSIAHIGDMDVLLKDIPLDQMNTSMTINATAAWLFGLYAGLAKTRKINLDLLTGTTQNDIIKEYLSRGTYIYPPEYSKRLTVDLILYCVNNVPKWNPINICSYHLQEAGATPTQEIAYALADAIAVLDATKESGQIKDDEFENVVARISFFVNSGIRFIEETCKMRAFNILWEKICKERYNVKDERACRFRYGVQVNSLGLTEAQPENNIPRIVLETLGVTLSKNARARAIQLPAWNEALGLPRPWDQQLSLRIQQILAYETDLLEYEDIFDGSKVIETKTQELVESAQAELNEIIELGGAFENLELLKSRLVESNAKRIEQIESGERKVVGLNCYTETEDSPLLAGQGASPILTVDPEVEQRQIEKLIQWKKTRDQGALSRSISNLKKAAQTNENIMQATIEFALNKGTTGEWANALREIFGEFRAPTGITNVLLQKNALAEAREKIKIHFNGNPPRFLVAKPGLDGHSNGAEQIAIAARQAGFEVIYQGIRLTPEQIAKTARDEDVDVIGISVLSGSHLELARKLMENLNTYGVKVPVVLGGIIPETDKDALKSLGIKAIYTPKDFDISKIIEDIADLVKAN